MYDAMWPGLHLLFKFENLIFLFIGVPIGIIFGALPGINSTTAMVLMLPFTFWMKPEQAVIFLMAIAGASIYGGAIPAILFGMPGTPGSSVTAIEGYAMTRNGEGIRALSISALASSIGAFLSGISLMVLAPLLAVFALTFSFPELVLIACFALIFLAAFKKSMTKGLLAALLGLLLATIGTDPFFGYPRMILGVVALYEGPSIIVALIGFLCFSEVLILCERQSVVRRDVETRRGIREVYLGISDVLHKPIHVLAGTITGIIVGAIPGAGTGIANFLGYVAGNALSKNPDQFGRGTVDGVIGPEAANSAVEGSSLILALTVGIPGSGMAAVVLAALMIHGIVPGPDVFILKGELVWAVMWSILLGAVVVCIVGLTLCNYFGRLVSLPISYLVPFLVLFMIIGSYAARNSAVDIVTMIVLGVLGYFMAKSGYERLAIVFPFILGGMIEQGIVLSLQRSDGNPLIFFQRPLDLVLWAFLVLGLLSIRWLKRRVERTAEPFV